MKQQPESLTFWLSLSSLAVRNIKSLNIQLVINVNSSYLILAANPVSRCSSAFFGGFLLLMCFPRLLLQPPSCVCFGGFPSFILLFSRWNACWARGHVLFIELSRVKVSTSDKKNLCGVDCVDTLGMNDESSLHHASAFPIAPQNTVQYSECWIKLWINWCKRC